MKPDPQVALDDPDEYVRQCFAGIPEQYRQLPEVRRRLTKMDPLLFALIYMRDSLRSPETGGKITLSEFHIDIAEGAKRWARQDLAPMELREAWVAPRGVGKSTWAFLILPAWCLAHGHRRYIAAFADNSTMAKNHLATFKRKIQTDLKLLQKDYPDLCRPAKRPGGVTDSDRQDLYLSKSGAIFQASGVESTTLGAKVGDQRPDLILMDDVEPPADQYSLAQKEGRLSLITEAIFPMNLNAVVQLVGTVTMEGSISHDIVRQAIEPGETVPAWVASEKIVTRYYPALMPDDGGGERSLWPARWSTEFLQQFRILSPRPFAMNYMNQPVPANSAYWTSEMFHTEMLVGLTKCIISVDPAVTTQRSSDYTGIAVMAWSDSEKRAMLRFADQVKLQPHEFKDYLEKLVERFGARMVLIETNQGGDTWKSLLAGLSIPVTTLHQTVKKELRWAESLEFWPRKWVVHEPDGHTGPFERQAIAVPKSANDDVVDAVVSGALYFMRARKVQPNQKRRGDRVSSYV